MKKQLSKPDYVTNPLLNKSRVIAFKVKGNITEATKIESEDVHCHYKDVVLVDNENQIVHRFKHLMVAGEVSDLITDRVMTFYLLRRKDNFEFNAVIYGLKYEDTRVFWRNETVMLLSKFGIESYSRHHYKWWIGGFFALSYLGLDLLYEQIVRNVGFFKYIIPESISSTLTTSGLFLIGFMLWPYVAGPILTKAKARSKAMSDYGYTDKEDPNNRPNLGLLNHKAWDVIDDVLNEFNVFSDKAFGEQTPENQPKKEVSSVKLIEKDK